MSTKQKLMLWAAVVLLAVIAAAILNWLQSRTPEVPRGHSPDAEAATVVRVVDGDTIVVELAGVEERVRLLNIDTPETVHPHQDTECGGPEATEQINELLEPGGMVVLEFDEERRDQYDRLLAGVFAEDTFVNEQMARDGWGEPAHFAPNDRFLEQVESAWQTAEEEGAGVFSAELDCAAG